MLFSVSPSQALLRELAERMEPQQLLQAHNDGIQSIEAQVGVPLCAWVALCACRVTLRFFFLVAVAC